MHIVFGGLFNGKRAYVKKEYNPNCNVTHDIENVRVSHKTVSIENFPQIIKPYIHLDEVEACEKIMAEILRIAELNEVVCVCDDVSRGVVPIDKALRKQRDILGRLYQQLFSQAKTITRIWYGIPEKLK